ncbi:MAG TPA: DoxX family protein [Blastocatellia bacterium]|nr:DoxX family protein [Blastocatellia bacterium]
MRKVRLVLKVLLGVFYIAAGLNHFIHTDFYMNIMPPYLPAHLFLVYLSGVCEAVLGLMVFVPKFTALAGWGLVALLIAVFPANIHMALHPQLYPNISPLALWIRLPLQAVLAAWAIWATRPGRSTVLGVVAAG